MIYTPGVMLAIVSAHMLEPSLSLLISILLLLAIVPGLPKRHRVGARVGGDRVGPAREPIRVVTVEASTS